MKHAHSHLQSRLEAIQSLEIDNTTSPPPGKRLNTSTEPLGSAYVAAGSIISFQGPISSQQRSDVLNSTLLAQLAADARVDRKRNPEAWEKEYVGILETLGWTISAMSQKSTVISDGQYWFTGNTLNLMSAVLPLGRLALLGAAEISLRYSAPKSKQTVVFDRFGFAERSATFQLGAAYGGVDGNVHLDLTFFHYSFAHDRPHTVSIPGSMNHQDTVLCISTKMVLNEQLYSSLRKSVEEKLGEKAEEYTAELDL